MIPKHSQAVSSVNLVNFIFPHCPLLLNIFSFKTGDVTKFQPFYLQNGLNFASWQGINLPPPHPLIPQMSLFALTSVHQTGWHWHDLCAPAQRRPSTSLQIRVNFRKKLINLLQQIFACRGCARLTPVCTSNRGASDSFGGYRPNYSWRPTWRAPVSPNHST